MQNVLETSAVRKDQDHGDIYVQAIPESIGSMVDVPTPAVVN
jgi:hypothetical protein